MFKVNSVDLFVIEKLQDYLRANNIKLDFDNEIVPKIKEIIEISMKSVPLETNPFFHDGIRLEKPSIGTRGKDALKYLDMILCWIQISKYG